MLVDITFRGIPLEVHGEEGKLGGFRIGKIMVEKQTDVYDLLEKHLEEIEQDCIEQIKRSNEQFK